MAKPKLKPRFIRQKDCEHVLVWTELLAEREDMIECNAKGEVVFTRGKRLGRSELNEIEVIDSYQDEGEVIEHAAKHDIEFEPGLKLYEMKALLITELRDRATDVVASGLKQAPAEEEPEPGPDEEKTEVEKVQAYKKKQEVREHAAELGVELTADPKAKLQELKDQLVEAIEDAEPEPEAAPGAGEGGEGNEPPPEEE